MMCKVFIYFHYSLSIKREIDRRQLKFQILTLLNASKVKTPRNWRYVSTCKIYTDSMQCSRQGVGDTGSILSIRQLQKPIMVFCV